MYSCEVCQPFTVLSSVMCAASTYNINKYENGKITLNIDYKLCEHIKYALIQTRSNDNIHVCLAVDDF